ncbi:MAG: flagellar protein FliT [Dechloromonas sp.]|nr:flagellar protein FliT [Dechloromonas sp.]
MNTSGYDTLLALSCQMLALAKQQDWESLAQVQEQRARLIAGLPPALASMTPAEQAAMRLSIQEIQGLDSEILAYVTPWREDVAKLLPRLSPSP